MEGSEHFPEVQDIKLEPMASKGWPYDESESIPDDAAIRETVYWFGKAMSYKVELQNCNKGLNRLNRQARRLKREKAELAVIIGDLELSLRSRRVEFRAQCIKTRKAEESLACFLDTE